MTTKIKRTMAVGCTMTVGFPVALSSDEWGYIVTSVTNSVDPMPGMKFSRGEIDAFIAQGWTVTVVSVS